MGTSLAAVAPLLIPLDVGCTAVEGFISPVDSREGDVNHYWLRLSGIPSGGRSLKGARLELGSELAHLLRGQNAVLEARLRESLGLTPFLLELRSLLSQAASRTEPSVLRPPSFYSSINEELEAIGWSRVSKLSNSLSSVALRTQDAAGRTHALSLLLPPGYPATPPCATADLPLPFIPRWSPGATRLRDVFQQFEEQLQQYQLLWDLLDELHNNAWIIEPTAPTRSCLYRRIALGNHSTLALTVDPLDPCALPDMQFMGAERAVEPLLASLRVNRNHWAPACSLHTNLETVLGISLPAKSAGEALLEDVGADCAICYNYRRPNATNTTTAGGGGAAPAAAGGGGGGGKEQREGGGEGMEVDRAETLAGAELINGNDEGDDRQVPDIYCDNAACGKPFHRECLREWLAADAATRQSFGRMFGACPYCTSPIAVTR